VHAPRLIAALALALSLGTAGVAAPVQDARFPDWSGQWLRTYGGNPRYDQTKPIRKQEAPLKPDYQARFEASVRDQDLGGHGLDTGYSCLPQGMPRMMSGVSPFEFVILPSMTYMIFERTEFAPRRIYTDGRDWPRTEQTWFTGYSIGRWLDTRNAGRYDTLEVETRNLRGPRVFDASGIPFHADGEAVIKERIYLDRVNPGVLRNEMTTFDHALTRPWTAMKSYKRLREVMWVENNCTENNNHLAAGKEDYMVSSDGLLMPVRKGQAPPDLKYFRPAAK